MSKELKALLNKHKSDKASKHNYHTVYGKDFDPIRELPIKILEVGVWKGESVAAWLEYFPNAEIYGIDIFERVDAKDIEVLNQERVHWLKADSNSPSLRSMIKRKWGDIEFDIIIDDGLHTPESNAVTFKNLIGLLKQGGAYYVEDVWPIHKMTMQEMNHPWVKNRPFVYNSIKMEMFLEAIKGYECQEFDLRKDGGPDSYLFRLTK